MQGLYEAAEKCLRISPQTLAFYGTYQVPRATEPGPGKNLVILKQHWKFVEPGQPGLSIDSATTIVWTQIQVRPDVEKAIVHCFYCWQEFLIVMNFLDNMMQTGV